MLADVLACWLVYTSYVLVYTCLCASIYVSCAREYVVCATTYIVCATIYVVVSATIYILGASIYVLGARRDISPSLRSTLRASTPNHPPTPATAKDANMTLIQLLPPPSCATCYARIHHTCHENNIHIIICICIRPLSLYIFSPTLPNTYTHLVWRRILKGLQGKVRLLHESMYACA